MSKFKIGDRVAMYSASTKYVGNVIEVTSTLVVILQTGKDVKPYRVWAHPKQCRRLKKKAPLKEVWVYVYHDGSISPVNHLSNQVCDPGERDSMVLFREVRKKK